MSTGEFFFKNETGWCFFVGCFFWRGSFAGKKTTFLGVGWIFPPTLSLFFQDKLPFNAAAPKEEILRLTKVGDPELFDPFWLLWLVCFTSLSMYITHFQWLKVQVVFFLLANVLSSS